MDNNNQVEEEVSPAEDQLREDPVDNLDYLAETAKEEVFLTSLGLTEPALLAHLVAVQDNEGYKYLLLHINQKVAQLDANVHNIIPADMKGDKAREQSLGMIRGLLELPRVLETEIGRLNEKVKEQRT